MPTDPSTPVDPSTSVDGQEPTVDDTIRPEGTEPVTAYQPSAGEAVRYDDGWQVLFHEAPQPLQVVDDLAEPDDWYLFEQIIPFRPECYRVGHSEATVVDSGGQPVLALTANATGSEFSNHALLGRYITSTPIALGRQRLTVEANLAPDAAGQIQTGPEMSVQTTAQMTDGSYRTAVFGLQYATASGIWQVLTGGTEKDAWTHVSSTSIRYDTWYRIELDFDTLKNRYLGLRVFDSDNLLIDEAIDGLGTGWEDKGATGPATWVTLDAENLFTCDDPVATTATVFYTGLSLNTIDG